MSEIVRKRLREKLREFFRQEVRPELRAVAALSNVELITALLSCNQQLALVGLQLRIINGVVSLLTTEVRNRAMAAYLSEHNAANGNSGLTTATLEVLACIAFKQPISQAEIDLLFDADKRGLVVTLRDLKLVEEFAGSDGRLRFATTRFQLLHHRSFDMSDFPNQATAVRLRIAESHSPNRMSASIVLGAHMSIWAIGLVVGFGLLGESGEEQPEARRAVLLFFRSTLSQERAQRRFNSLPTFKKTEKAEPRVQPIPHSATLCGNSA